MDKKAYWLLGAGLLGAALLSSCGSIPKKAKPIGNFKLDRYLGKWFEIARFDYRFEKNLNNVTAEYSLNDDGTVNVINRGFHMVKRQWKSARGKAKFRKDKQTAALKVSFFGPFYSGYNVIAIDKDYQYALVAGESLKYLWILSRTPEIPDHIKQDYLSKAKNVGYDISKLIWVAHDTTSFQSPE
ncbi:lipocalin family protein [Parapedobacter indicus]|uniref:Outer membrane lipoprotein Blc n=1 Tax=Parapedobacter indicus TaxID=1477437 RepID=A0A1I3GQW0_9SPHI|nr:lipocalin family protein [Parapedobacter indicus]PPL02748.1 apolipoprotein D and lipocalin family protein [Parapedobacter indicus]SFI25830.1 apolipoprotein D and lipocalin family protein [Parapedobacter indicus]